MRRRLIEDAQMAVETRDIALEEGASKGRYVYRGEGGAAEMTFSKAGAGLLIVDHTEVSDGLRGMGVGQALVLRAVEDARAAGRRILPLCPFAAAQFRRHPEWGDVLDGPRRR
jgi:predicted GNAT family acetyltransferase